MILTMLVIGFGAAYYTLVGPTGAATERDKITTAALVQVKEALIGWSASRTPTVASPNIRPGELPCPDATNSGNDPGPTCSAGAIGRVPWKSLGIPEPKDSAGETLWYAVSGPFRHYGAPGSPANTTPITSDTQGTLTVYSGSSTNPLTPQAVAVIFAPGAAFGAQDRSPTATALCATTGTTIARNLCATNYLDIGDSINNATPTMNATPPSFIQAQPLPTFNDRLLVITNADLMPAVEQRVAKELMSILERYRVATGYYPWADLSTGASDVDNNRHRIPCGTASPTTWGLAGITLPNWFTNGCDCTTGLIGKVSWACVIFYAVAKNSLSGSSCTTCGSSTAACGSTTSSITTLTVANTSSQAAHLCLAGSVPFTCNPTVLTTGSANLVLITPGAYSGSPARSWPTTLAAITGYFDDPQNSDNDNFNCYYVPTSTNLNRDRIYVVR